MHWKAFGESNSVYLYEGEMNRIQTTRNKIQQRAFVVTVKNILSSIMRWRVLKICRTIGSSRKTAPRGEFFSSCVVRSSFVAYRWATALNTKACNEVRFACRSSLYKSCSFSGLLYGTRAVGRFAQKACSLRSYGDFLNN